MATTQPALQLEITAGIPSYYAVLVDSTNYATASWQTFATTNLVVNLGTSPAQGWHELWVGLKGSASTSTATWIWKRLKFDTIPPLIVITNPATGTVNVPMIQLAGYSPEELDGISCNLSNALGVVTNLDIGTTERYHEETTWEFTTNYFECLDVELTTNLNRITIIATDLAGNVTTTNFDFTLDYTGKPTPVITLMWPTNAMKLAGNKFTLIGYVTDPTATVVGQTVNTVGVTNQVEADVERDGRFWVDNLPLSAGTNWLTLTVTDAVNHVTTTNIWVTQSTLSLGMNPVMPESDLWKPKVNLTGTINDSTQAVWVNGVKGQNHGDGTWSADEVPTTPGGVAIFRIDAYEANEQQPDGSYGNP